MPGRASRRWYLHNLSEDDVFFDVLFVFIRGNGEISVTSWVFDKIRN
jgi:hypothetical protein